MAGGCRPQVERNELGRLMGIESSGSFQNTRNFLDRIFHLNPRDKIEHLAQKGVAALEQHTPKDSGLTAQSWAYEIVQNGSEITIWWTNDHIVNGFKVAIGLQYGHGTGTGGYIQGREYINLALQPIFDEIGNAVWEEVQKL